MLRQASIARKKSGCSISRSISQNREPFRPQKARAIPRGTFLTGSSSPLSSGQTVLTGPCTALRVVSIVTAHILTVGSTRAAPQAHGVRSHSLSASGIRGARGVRWASSRASARSVQPQYGCGDVLEPLGRHRRPERARRNVGAEALTTVTTVTTVPDRPTVLTVPDRTVVTVGRCREALYSVATSSYV